MWRRESQDSVWRIARSCRIESTGTSNTSARRSASRSSIEWSPAPINVLTPSQLARKVRAALKNPLYCDCGSRRLAPGSRGLFGAVHRVLSFEAGAQDRQGALPVALVRPSLYTL